MTIKAQPATPLAQYRLLLKALKRSGKNGDGNIKPSLENLLIIFDRGAESPLFRRNTFACQDHYWADAPWTGASAGKPVTDDDAVAIKEWIARTFGFEPTIGTIHEAITAIALRNGFHPVQEELKALPKWDGIERLNNWLAKYFKAEGPEEYLAQVFTKWLVASVTRTFEPGAKFDWLPIFEGKQGIGKSSFGAILFGQKYFADWLPNLSDKDAALTLLGKRCIEFAELDGLKRAEVETVKAFVTRQVDYIRPPYGRKNIELPRGVVFFGTTNREQYLRDDTGNRRFCPIKVGDLDFEALRRDRDQLWAEAVAIYERGNVSLYLEGSAKDFADSIRKEKMAEDDVSIMEDMLRDYLERERARKIPSSKRFQLQKFKLSDLFETDGPLQAFKLNARNGQFASRALKRLKAFRLPGTKIRYWSFPKDEPHDCLGASPEHAPWWTR